MVAWTQCRAAWIILALTLCCACFSDAAPSKKSPSKSSGLWEQWKSASKKEIAQDAISAFVIYEGLTLGWMYADPTPLDIIFSVQPY
jgi:hypothetical protein